MSVKIHGKEYHTVGERVAQIHADYADNISIETVLVSQSEIINRETLKAILTAEGISKPRIEGILDGIAAREVIVQAKVTIHTDKGDRLFTDLAHEVEETKDKKAVNYTSFLENASTSAIGRALAAAGRGGTEYPSADELASALSRGEHVDGKPARQEQRREQPNMRKGNKRDTKAPDIGEHFGKLMREYRCTRDYLDDAIIIAIGEEVLTKEARDYVLGECIANKGRDLVNEAISNLEIEDDMNLAVREAIKLRRACEIEPIYVRKGWTWKELAMVESALELMKEGKREEAAD